MTPWLLFGSAAIIAPVSAFVFLRVLFVCIGGRFRLVPWIVLTLVFGITQVLGIALFLRASL